MAPSDACRTSRLHLYVLLLSTLASAMFAWGHLHPDSAFAGARTFGLYESSNFHVYTAPDFMMQCGVTAGCDTTSDDGTTTVLAEDPGQFAPRRVAADVYIGQYPFVQQFGLSARAVSCDGFPVLHPVVDGISLPATTIASTSYATYTWNLPRRLGVGWHHVDVWYDNPHYSLTCPQFNYRRKAYLDWFGLRPGTPHPVFAPSSYTLLRRQTDLQSVDGWATIMFSNPAGPTSHTWSDTYVVVNNVETQEIGVSVRAAPCNGWGRLQVSIDGRTVGYITPMDVGSYAWHWISIPAGVAAGGHHVSINWLDPLYAPASPGCPYGQRFANIDDFILGT